ncbi:hypothetical protein [Streptomyces sp. NBC_00385]|uniref:hypothetical protein n=1 Tax=Streptomyces sp. NBC_00385 TaxID=2975733 RepID=UPI002DDA879C|nr:hypothetical protein [Streptomyces sp. NBC_00385]WRZ03201.1 hypothetical protein OG959_07535 [Streptomyces sp. NBC_00385]
MPRTTDEQPTTPGSALWLKGQLLEIASASVPGCGPVLVREWTDPVRLRDPDPVGHRFLFLVCVSWDDRSSSTGIGDALNAFTAAGWSTSRRSSEHPGESGATAHREDFEVRVYAGNGPGFLTFTGWTPVVYTGQQWGQPQATLSTARGVLCDDCHGWGLCLLCEGRAYTGGSGGYGRCSCAGNNAGPGTCAECAGRGLLPAEAVAWKRSRYGLPDAGDSHAFPQPPAEDGHVSNADAFTDVGQRSCACGEFRCFWRNILSDADDHLLSRFAGVCQGCAAQRAYAFRLPLP